MPLKPPVRDVSPFLQRVRAFLLGREHVCNQRQVDNMVCRSQPPPNLPNGVSYGLSANYYFSRDGRRAVESDQVLAINSSAGPTKLISDITGEEGAVTVAVKKPKTPGSNYGYDSGFTS
ncbi:NADH dehydrogenase [ubiquinone] 1 alpha subcomplex subunit 7 [Halocaridina rubra]|uniref:NADH dehydrogenase [ubiquinone] 1 alpha subcomplex subunit 7 n=1 Tax=Halocaridina rubra TaxID=373956 RepID=A0AAN8X730_HALRR